MCIVTKYRESVNAKFYASIMAYLRPSLFFDFLALEGMGSVNN
jgi:hypothetical protein